MVCVATFCTFWDLAHQLKGAFKWKKQFRHANLHISIRSMLNDSRYTSFVTKVLVLDWIRIYYLCLSLNIHRVETHCSCKAANHSLIYIQWFCSIDMAAATCMENNPSWGASAFTASQDIPRNFGIQSFISFFTRAHHCSPILRQKGRSHALASYFFKVHFNSIISST